MIRINTKISEILKQKNISSKEFEELTGLTRTLVESLLDKATMRLGSVRSICDGLGITMADAFREQEEIFELDEEQMEGLTIFNKLLPEKQNYVLEYMRYVMKNSEWDGEEGLDKGETP